jgi:hypothetical protein
MVRNEYVTTTLRETWALRHWKPSTSVTLPLICEATRSWRLTNCQSDQAVKAPYRQMPDHSFGSGLLKKVRAGCIASAAATLLTVLIVGCGTTPTASQPSSTPSSETSPSASTSPAASPTAIASPTPSVPSDWPTVTDSKYGFVLRYPTGWSDVSQRRGDAPGTDEVTSRASATSPAGMIATDWWLTAQAHAPDPSIGCGEPVTSQKSADQLDGQSATRYVRNGTQSDATAQIIDVIAVRGGNCYDLQLITGGGVPAGQATTTFDTIKSSFHFGA